MDIFGVGIGEFLLIILIMLVLLGPRDMILTARKAGVFIRKVIRSPYWAAIMDTSREIRDIPARLVREAGIEEDLKAMRAQTSEQAKIIQELKQEIDTASRKAASEADLNTDIHSIKAPSQEKLPADGNSVPETQTPTPPVKADEPVPFNSMPYPKPRTTADQEVVVPQAEDNKEPEDNTPA